MTYLTIPTAKHLPPRNMRVPAMSGLGFLRRTREAIRGRIETKAEVLMPASRVEPDPIEIDWGDEPAPPSGQIPVFPPAPKSDNKALLIGGGLLAAAGLVAAVALID